MENLMLYVLKINVLAAACILSVFILSYFVKGRYTSQWKYLMWLFIAVSLLIPKNLFAETTVVKLELHRQDLAADISVSGEKVDEVNFPDIDQSDKLAGNSAGSSQKAYAASDPVSILPEISVADFLTLACYVWMAGVMLLTIWRFVSYRLSLSKIKRWGIAVKDEGMRAEYVLICREMGVGNPPKLFVNSNIQSPVLVGVIHTRLYLPDISYTESELALIFAHELSHYSSRDLWYKALLMAVNTIYWFNPFIYFMVREAEKDVEYICDSKVIAKCSRSECMLYNRLLLKTAAASTSIHYLTASLNDSTTAFKERVLYMMKVRTLKHGILPVIVLTITLVASNAVLGCTLKVYATAENLKIAEKPESTQVPTKTLDKASEIETKITNKTKKTADTLPKQKPEVPEAAPVPTSAPKQETAAVPESTAVPAQEAAPKTEPVIVQEVPLEATPEPTPEPLEDKVQISGDEPLGGSGDSGLVNAAVQLVEGSYFDAAAFGEDTVEKYYEVSVTNIMANAFDFTIYEVDVLSGGSEIVFLTNTALFTGDGTTAAYEGEDYTLSFSFPDNHGAYPVVTDIVISGFEPLEGKTLVSSAVS